MAMWLCTAPAAAQPDVGRMIRSLEDADYRTRRELEKQIIAAGMEAHDLLYEGSDASADQRAALRKRIRSARDNKALASGLVAHEWGAVTYVNGLDGATIGKLGDDYSHLPGFVETWSGAQTFGVQLMRKPVLYFYTRETRDVTVLLRCDEGMLTQWYPKATTYRPVKTVGHIPRMQDVKGGYVQWNDVRLLPDSDTGLAEVAADHPWWHTLREPKAATVQVNGQREKFLFYRGIGNVEQQVTVSRLGEDDRFRIANRGADVDHVFVIRVADGKASIQMFETLTRGEAREVDLSLGEDAGKVGEVVPGALAQWTERLEAKGLFPVEADGVSRIWKDEFFTKPGTRVVYTLRDVAVDGYIRMTVRPEPARTVRVMLVHVELVTDQARARIDGLITQLGDADFRQREAAERELMKLDRVAEVKLRAAMASTEDPEIAERCERILSRIEAMHGRPTE